MLYEDNDPYPVAEEIPIPLSSLYPEWHAQAKCLGLGHQGEGDDLFFGSADPEIRPPYTLGEIKKARALCADCPIAQTCLRSALVNREEYGVWAGTTRNQRKSMLRAIDMGLETVDSIVAKYFKKQSKPQRVITSA